MTDIDLLKPAQAHLTEKKAAIDAMAANFKVDESGNFELSTKQYSDYTAAVREAKEAKAFIDAVNEAKSIEEYLVAPASTPAAAGGLSGSGVEAKSLADVFMGSTEFKSAKEAGFRNVARISGELEGKSIHALSAGTYTANALGTVQSVGITERAMRKTRIRDLFPKSSTTASALHGVIETGWVNNAKQVRQRYAADGTSPATGADSDVFGHKPKSKITLRNVLYPVATIAHTLDAHKNILDDEPRLKTFLNMRMAEGVKYAEDYDLLHSVGGSEEITGLFNVTGVQNYTGKATDKYSVQIRRAITKAQLAEYDPTGIVISPEMWENVEVEEDGYGGFRVAVNVAVGAVKQVWHLDVACTTAMSDANFLIGAFGLGAQLHDRETVNVTMSTENADNFERNVVTFRAEERLALEVPRPESFVIGSWTTPV
ncbi:MAG TPA: phage major capsid protein [Phytomonospora sp.]